MRTHVGALYLALRPSLFRFPSPQHPSASNSIQAPQSIQTNGGKNTAPKNTKNEPKASRKTVRGTVKTVQPLAQRGTKVRDENRSPRTEN
jgi:hypothetical protein